MFGVVPRVLWAPHEKVDDQNRIELAARTLIAVSKDRKHVILVDTGMGCKWSEKSAARFAIRHEGQAISDALEKHFRLSTGDVTDIVVTHLHFDHNGGLTNWVDESEGQTELCFPNARHWMHRRHWDHVHNPSEKDRSSFHLCDYEILDGAGVLQLVDGSKPESPWPGLRFFVSDGHTPGQLLAIFGSGSDAVMFTGDVIPTSSHLRLPWVMAYDLEPLKTIDEKKHILDRCREDGMRLAFPHDMRLGIATLDFAAGRALVAGVLQS